MKVKIDENLRRFINDIGFDSSCPISQKHGGINSKVLMIRHKNCKYIVKDYCDHRKTTRSRLEAEYSFLQLLQRHGVSRVPKPLRKDVKHGYGLYSFVPGEHIRSPSIRHVLGAAQFIEDINIQVPQENRKGIGNAAESCFSIQDHLDVVHERIQRLVRVSSKQPGLGLYNEIVESLIQEKYKQIHDQILVKYSGASRARPINPKEKIISPSDFGFHNMLVHKDAISFIDFEYSGWDDPAKLWCDFSCQPEVPINEEQRECFVSTFSDWLPNYYAVKERSDDLLLLYRLKWCCIMLNGFTDERIVSERSMRKIQEEELDKQINKTISYFNSHLEGI
jgi:thiamine kinase-like enzyme